jgi:hypothetical protein
MLLAKFSILLILMTTNIYIGPTYGDWRRAYEFKEFMDSCSSWI